MNRSRRSRRNKKSGTNHNQSNGQNNGHDLQRSHRHSNNGQSRSQDGRQQHVQGRGDQRGSGANGQQRHHRSHHQHDRHGGGGQSQRSSAPKDDRKLLQGSSPLEFGKVVESLPSKKQDVIFYDTLAQAKQDLEVLARKQAGCDQLNIVIRAEADMNDPVLMKYGKVFAGAAWALIHDRRVAEGWYTPTV